MQSVEFVFIQRGVFHDSAPLLDFHVREAQGEGSKLQVRHKKLSS